MKSMTILSFAAATAAALALSGCLFVRSTEHRITLNSDGSGEATMRLKDIRSDSNVDSLVKRDFAKMMIGGGGDDAREFEQYGRKITKKELTVSGDTLDAEISYRFPALSAIEGLHAGTDEMYLVIPETREVVRTNGTLAGWSRNETKISWPRTSRRLYFEVREKNLGQSTQLGALYARYVLKK